MKPETTSADLGYVSVEAHALAHDPFALYFIL